VKPVRIAQPASEEFAAAVVWYESKRAGLGAEFLQAVGRVVDLLREHPALGAALGRGAAYRHLLVSHFPYRIVYVERTDDLYIVAIAHLSRRPGYWRHRQ
jgi:toxin ParE1/3/4